MSVSLCLNQAVFPLVDDNEITQPTCHANSDVVLDQLKKIFA